MVFSILCPYQIDGTSKRHKTSYHRNNFSIDFAILNTIINQVKKTWGLKSQVFFT